MNLPEKDLWTYLKEQKRPIVLYGMRNGADSIITQLERNGLAPDGVFASDGFVRGHSFRGMKVMNFEDAKKQFPDMIALVCFGSQLTDVMEHICSLDAEVYAPDVPVAGGEVFTCEYAHKHICEIERTYSLLEDDLSKKTFQENIFFKLDGKISHLKRSETDNDEMMSLLHLNDNERYLDMGAYNGDTVLDFVSRVKNWESITALEPDKRNYRKLLANTENLHDLVCLNKAVSDKCGLMGFQSSGGRNSKLGGRNETETVTVDSLKSNFSYIKMDVEGEEYRALSGARKALKEKPKMLISAYHKSEDIFSLPLLVKSINPEYKVYLRHLPYIPAWDTNYIFV